MNTRRNVIQGLALSSMPATMLSDPFGRAHAATKQSDEIDVFELGDQKSADTLRVSRRPMPRAGKDQVLVKVHYSAIVARDFRIVSGNFLAPQPPERIPLCEGSGEVMSMGEGVSGISVGDRVTANHLPDWQDGLWDTKYYAKDIGNSMDGWLADYVLMPSDALIKLPAGVSYETAATLSSSGLTAWQGLFEVRPLTPGNIVLTLGTGGVSMWALLLAKAAGATVAITSSSDEKLSRARALGADITINYKKNPNWAEEVYKKTNGRGADIVLENVGRVNIDKSMPAAASAGTVVLIGTRPPPPTPPEMKDLFLRNLTLRAIFVGSTRMYRDLVSFIDRNNLTPVISETFPFTEAKKAFDAMNNPSRMGKVVIRHE